MGLSNFGKDTVAKAIGGDSVGITGTATGTSATTLTTSAVFTASIAGPPDTGGHVGHIVVAGSASPFVYGVILSNTTTVLTVDQWHSMTAPETVGSTPGATTPFCIIPGGAPAFYMGISVAARAFNAADNFLTNDGTTISELWFSGGGLRRRLASWAHTTGTATYTLANTFTANGSDTLPQTITKIGIFQHFVNAAVTTSNTGGVLFQTALTSSATLSASGDNVAITDTITLS